MVGPKGGHRTMPPPKYATGRDTVQQTRWLTHSFAGISRIMRIVIICKILLRSLLCLGGVAVAGRTGDPEVHSSIPARCTAG